MAEPFELTGVIDNLHDSYDMDDLFEDLNPGDQLAYVPGAEVGAPYYGFNYIVTYRGYGDRTTIISALREVLDDGAELMDDDGV